MAERNYVAFDLGAESGRSVLGTLNSGKLTLEVTHRFPNLNSRMNGHLHWNLLDQWDQIKTGLTKSVAQAPANELAGIGMDTWGVDFGLLSKSGEILGTPVHYRDSRTDGVMDRTFAKLSRDKIYESTGIQFMQLNTLFQLMAMREAKSDLLDAADTMLFMPDLFNYLFTGERKSEYSIASTSQMLDARTGQWATGMLQQLGLPTKILPQIVPSGSVIGPIQKRLMTELNVGAIPVIAPGCHDTASAVAAAPAEGGDWCYISSGTWSLMGVEIDKPILTPKALQLNYTNEGGVGGKIRFLKNIMGLWLVQECRRQFLKEGHDHSYSELTTMASRAEGLRSLIDLDHAPFGLPGQMINKIEDFCKATHQPVPNSRGEFVRCCLDSLALTYRKTLDGLEAVLGKKIAVIHIVGGGTQNELLNQMTADACGRPVVAGPVEATAIGNVLVQAMATGDVPSLAAARTIVRNSFDVKRYEPADTGKWDAAYEKFKLLKT